MDRHNQLGFNSVTQLILLLAIYSSLPPVTFSSHAGDHSPPTELRTGFRASLDPSLSSFQPLLTDSSGNFSLGFLRVNQNQASLSVIHVRSSVPVWSASMTRFARWASQTELQFNGSLVLSDSHSGVFWSTHTNGGRIFLTNTSNLQIQTLDGGSVLWESFNFPSDTLVENQNFSNTQSLISSNGIYSMRLGPNYFGLYAKFSGSEPGPGQIYLKHNPLEVKADVIEGQPIFLILQSAGFLGMYQNGSLPVDVEPFYSFQQNLTGFRRVRIESDGNLKGYYWTGSSWVLDYEPISDTCQLPSSCGSYSLCRSGKGCSCLDNRTAADDSGGCAPTRNQLPGGFCGAYNNRFKVLRRTGVELPFKELMGYKRMNSIEQCEEACERNCTCWGAVYSNSSGFCYTLDYPIQTLVAVGDEGKVGYFKVRESVGKKNVGIWLGVVFGVVLVFAGVLGVVWYKLKRRGVKGYLEEEGVGAVGPYKDLGAASFRSIELCEK